MESPLSRCWQIRCPVRTCFLVHRWPSCFVLSWQKRSLAFIHVHGCRDWAQRAVFFCHIHGQLPSFFCWSFTSSLYKYFIDLLGHFCSSCFTTGRLGGLRLVLISLRYVSALYFLLVRFFIILLSGLQFIVLSLTPGFLFT